MDISLAPVVAAVGPLVGAAGLVLLAWSVRFAAAELSAHTGIKIEADALDKLTSAAQAEAGAMVAAADDNLAGAKITVSNPLIASAATRIINAFPQALSDAGVTPDHVSTMVAGALGQLQASMTAPPAAPAGRMPIHDVPNPTVTP